MRYEVRITVVYHDGVTKYLVCRVGIGVFDGAEYYDTFLCRSVTIEVFLKGTLVDRYER